MGASHGAHREAPAFRGAASARHATAPAFSGSGTSGWNACCAGPGRAHSARRTTAPTSSRVNSGAFRTMRRIRTARRGRGEGEPSGRESEKAKAIFVMPRTAPLAHAEVRTLPATAARPSILKGRSATVADLPHGRRVVPQPCTWFRCCTPHRTSGDSSAAVQLGELHLQRLE